DKEMADAGIIGKRLPFQADPTMRKKINDGGHLFVDQHLSHTAEVLRQDAMGPINYAILEAVSITEDGMIIPTTSIGNSLAFAENAENIIVEINTAQPDLERVDDLYTLENQGERAPIPLTEPEDRIAASGTVVDPDKIKGIDFTDQIDSAPTIVKPEEETTMMADHLLDFLRCEVAQ